MDYQIINVEKLSTLVRHEQPNSFSANWYGCVDVMVRHLLTDKGSVIADEIDKQLS